MLNIYFQMVHDAISGVARSLVLAGHLLYASPLASYSRALSVRARDMSGTNMVVLTGHVPGQARPSLRHWMQYC